MTLDAEFLRMLVCPSTRKPLREANATELQRVNAAISLGQVRNCGGNPVLQPLAAGLLPEGSAVIYPILEGIPILLSAEAIPFESVDATRTANR